LIASTFTGALPSALLYSSGVPLSAVELGPKRALPFG
jgi:hypothetical protein